MVIQETFIDKSSIPLRVYLREVAQIPLLSIEDEVKHAKLSVKGDEFSRNILVKSNLRFVISVAKQYSNNPSNILDLINEGNIGLIEAANTFDSSRGFRFITFAIWNIRGRILNHLNKNGEIYSMPNYRVNNVAKLKKIISTFECQICREVYPEDLYGNIDGMSDSEIDDLYSLIKYRSVSISKGISGDDITLEDTMSGSSYDDILDGEDQEYNTNLLYDLVGGLEPRLSNLMNLCHGLNGHQQIGKRGYAEKYDLTVTRVGQLHEVAIRHLRLIGTGKMARYTKPDDEIRTETITETRTEITQRVKSHTKKPFKKIIINGKPLSEDRTDYVIKSEKTKRGFINLIKGLFN